MSIDHINEKCLEYMKSLKKDKKSKVKMLPDIKAQMLDYLDRSDLCELGSINDKYCSFETGKNGKIPKYINPILSLYTTAMGRIKLYDALEKYKDNIIYYDTDSLFMNRKAPTSEELGDLKLEHELQKLVVVAPKFYEYEDLDGSTKTRIKGVPRADTMSFSTLLAGKQVSYSKVTKTRESLRKNRPANQSVIATKTSSLKDSKRLWDKPFSLTSWCDSRPITIKDVL
jgi:hypothetical protein